MPSADMTPDTAVILVFCVSTNKHMQMICDKACKIIGSQSSVAKNLSLLGCDTVMGVLKECSAFSYNGDISKDHPDSHVVTFCSKKV